MPSYSNGYIPEHLLVTFATGWSQNDGNWKHQLSPAAYARHLALVKRARDRTGRALQVANGWGAYRPYYAQVIGRNLYGNGAATPGTSSHGGFWEGRQTLATDYSNWGAVYGWDQDAFFADCRAVGLWPGMIMRSRGYPDEPWHVVDPDPWGAVPAFDGVFTPFPTEEDDMTPEQASQLDAVYKALFGPNNGPAKTTSPLGWRNIDGSAQQARYGVLPVVIHNQTLIAKQAGRLAAIAQVVEQLSAANGAVLDMAAVEAAAERGAREALSDLQVTISTGEQ